MIEDKDIFLPPSDSVLPSSSRKLPSTQCPRLIFFIEHAEGRIQMIEGLLAHLSTLLQSVREEADL